MDDNWVIQGYIIQTPQIDVHVAFHVQTQIREFRKKSQLQSGDIS